MEEEDNFEEEAADSALVAVAGAVGRLGEVAVLTSRAVEVVTCCRNCFGVGVTASAGVGFCAGFGTGCGLCD